MYLLKMNTDGEIVGGEWLYDSNDKRPDFLWFTKGKPALTVFTSFGLSFANVTVLLQKATACLESRY
ncbi:hypothetical protein PPTG_09883 [Phytophthora nicotianae INRA-310]|uniref:Uncharacterized protein n=1 Tax=Phytophthora nicotianae (strain INRA-310) TaxID=761204 RepID=W2QCE9_PHYN3|nr:hypothetical protein PPTG_09883 [Phytophthora nicotianae INRA-310]ETN10812.1 hypothetical protein PPTG_09883 [Phytophthora nicotianae INRA-310]